MESDLRLKIVIRRVLLLVHRTVSPIFEILRQIRQIRILGKLLVQSGLSINAGRTRRVFPEVAIFIPVAPKDYDKISRAIRSLRKNLLNPIAQIVVCGESDLQLSQICAELQCEFVDENTIAPIRKVDIEVNVNGIDRSGWIFQQMLKLNLFECVGKDNALIWDADTCLNRKNGFFIR